MSTRKLCLTCRGDGISGGVVCDACDGSGDSFDIEDNRKAFQPFGMTQTAIGKKLGMSKGNVWRIEMEALAKMRAAAEQEAAAAGMSVREWLIGEFD